jgi:hypothetical protein
LSTCSLRFSISSFSSFFSETCARKSITYQNENMHGQCAAREYTSFIACYHDTGECKPTKPTPHLLVLA